MELSIDVLIFVEDPGAANYVADFPSALKKLGRSAVLLADGYAKKYLAQRDVECVPMPHPATSDQVLGRFNPKLLIVGTSGNPDTLGLELIASARSMRIETIGVIDGLGNSDYRFRGKTDYALSYMPDWMAVPDEWTKEEYVKLGYPEDRIEICGHPHYDSVMNTAAQLAHQDRKVLREKFFPDAPDDVPVVVFLSEPLAGLDPSQCLKTEEYTLNGRGTVRNRTLIAIEEFLDAVRNAEAYPYLVLRLHPKNTIEEFTEYLTEFDKISVDNSPHELIFAADLVVGMTTILLMEAIILGRRTFSILPRPKEKGFVASIRAGFTPYATTRRELREGLSGLLKKDSQGQSTYKNFSFAYGSLKKNIDFIQSVLRSHASC